MSELHPPTKCIIVHYYHKEAAEDAWERRHNAQRLPGHLRLRDQTRMLTQFPATLLPSAQSFRERRDKAANLEYFHHFGRKTHHMVQMGDIAVPRVLRVRVWATPASWSSWVDVCLHE